MYQFDVDTADKAALYRDLAAALEALVVGERDWVANCANAAAAIWQYLPDLNWAGFYRVVDGGLVLGPFQGRPACIRIAMGAGVCGAAAASGEIQCVADVHAFPGHIACDAASAAELVAPIVAGGRVVAVLDLDSPVKGRFGEADVAGAARLSTLLANAIG